MKRWYAANRKAVIAYLGGKCQLCGFSDERALQVDHINGDGYKDRSHACWMAKVLREPSRYQLLCANCNFIKRVENNEQRRKEVIDQGCQFKKSRL